MTDNPLNPSLYYLLSTQPGGVTISNPGVRLEYECVYDAEKRRWKLLTPITGEYYVMRCPLCGDYKSRLYVNHAWRTVLRDKAGLVIPDPHLTDHLIRCFNCNAEQDYVPLDGISSKRVNKFVKYFGAYKPKPMNQVVKKATAVAPIYVPPPPMILLRDLPADHRARQYLLNRPGHPVDPDYISDVHGVGYAHTFPYGDEEHDVVLRTHQRANDRLVIPLVKDGKIVHWQARVVDDNDARSRWQFPPGSKPFPFRNWDEASKYRGVVVVEGYFDEVAAGPCGLTIFTKDMNFQKAKMIAEQWEYVIVALDKKETQQEVTDDNGQKRMGGCHIVSNRLLAAGISKPPVIFEYPADAAGKDPSAMGPAAFWAALHQQLSKEYFDAISVPRR